jgi:hypothetical protein
MTGVNHTRVLESAIEQNVSRYAETLGMMVLKLNVIGSRGWPDRLYMYQGRTLFIEFKRLKAKPEKAQEYIHAKLRNQGFHVTVVDNVKQGRDIVDLFTHGGKDV